MKILSLSDEQKLSYIERINYYESLRDYLLSTPHEDLTPGSLTVCPIINPIVRNLLYSFCGYEIEVIGSEKIDGVVGIYAHTHQSKFDHINLVASNPNHTILLNSSVLSQIYKLVLMINGVVYVDKSSKESRRTSKLELMRLLLNDKSITIFPESAWNLSPNKLHLPLYVGLVDMAKKTNKPIIPVVQQYNYDVSKLDGVERIDSVIVEYGKPIFVSEDDDVFEKLEEYSTAIATMRWNLIEQNGLYKRNEISNFEYINFLKGCIRNLEAAGIDVKVEEEGIFGSSDDLYSFYYLNAVDYDENGNLLPKGHVRKLERTHF